MVLIALVPLLTSTLSSLLAETAAGKLAEHGANKGKGIINKITKKLFDKELFKKKVHDLSVEDLHKVLNKLVPKGLDEFVKVAHEELKQILLKADDIEVILKATIEQVTETISKLEAKNDAMLELVKQTLITKRESLPDQCLDPDWYADLKSEIQYANQHNLQFVTSFQSQLANFQKNLEFILREITHVSKKATIINIKVTRILRMLQEKFKNQELTEKELCKLSKLRIENYKDFSSKGDIAFASEKYSERTSDKNTQSGKTVLDNFINQSFTTENQAKKRFFLLVGEAGMGKTWFLTKIAITYVKHAYPVFFITLRDGIETRLKQIFNINERSTVDQGLIELQNELSRWLILIFDGFDEIEERDEKRTLIHRYLRLLQTKLKNTLIIISSRNADWFRNEETKNGNSIHIKNTLWHTSGNQYSYNLQQFSAKEQITVFQKYKSQQVAELDTWEKEIRDIALRPVWMRLVCELYEKGYTPSFDSIKIYTEYFNRVILNTQHYELIGEISKLLLVKNGKLSGEFSARTMKFRAYRKEITDLYSKNILVESNPKNQRGEKYKFMTPQFGYYGLAYHFYQKLFELHQAVENIQFHKKNAIKLKKDLDNKLEQKLRNTVYALICQMPNEYGDDDIDVEEELKKLEDISLPPGQITITQLITTIQHVEKIYKAKNILLFRIAKKLNVTVKELILPLEQAILKERIKGTIDDRETVDENDDIIRLEENWNMSQIIQDKLTEAKILLQPKKIDNLDKAKKLVQELEVCSLQEEEIKAKQQLVKEIDEIITKDKFTRTIDLLRNATLQNLEQAKEILQSLQRDDLPGNQLVKLKKLSEKTESQITTFKFEEISNYLSNPTLDKLNQAKSKLLELKDSELTPENRVTKQNLLLTISNEHYIQVKSVEISNAKQEIKQLAESGQLVNAEIQELKSKYKEHLTELDFKFLKKYKTEEYNELSPKAREKMVLNQLERMCDRQIPLVNEIKSNTFGYSSNGTTITGLGLYGQGLSSLPESLSLLKNLQRLDLDNNELSSLPESLSSLKKLQYLRLSNNQLSSLPESLSKLRNLRSLALDNNQLSSLPESLSLLKNLQRLDLDNNELSSLPETLSSFKKLQYLRLSNNQLSSLPESLSKLQNLRSLALDNNQLSSLPESFSKLYKLQRLDLHHNQLSSLPESLSSLRNLQILDLDSNELSSLPVSLSKLHKLQELYLQHNRLVSLPKGLFSLKKLQILDLDDNELSSLPGNLSLFKNLRKLSLSNNKLLALPTGLASLQGLQGLNLDGNKLSYIPGNIKLLKNLQTLHLDSNQLSSFSTRTKNVLKKLRINGCQITEW